jgi:DNA-binding winged helix-turn-helix (wHTH) protein/TolB-like protein/Tfp pilus assembly protein PilF
MPTYRFDDFALDPDAGQLRLRGNPVRLERRPFDLLALLVAHPGRVHTREELIAALWPGRVVIDFESGLNTLVRKVRHALGDSPEAPHYIETIPSRGYRFIAPVAIADTAGDSAVPAPESARASTPKSPPGVKRPWRRRAFAGILLLAVLAVFFLLRIEEPAHLADIRIAVLPFENLSGDADLAYLASGLAQETSTSLGQIDLSNLTVLGVVSSRAIANSELPLTRAARKVGVDFIVDSSLRLDGTHIRVTSNLVRTQDGEQLWSASFDRKLTNVLGLQRELSVAIAEQVRQRLSPAVAAAIDRRQTQNPEAYRLYLKGREQWAQFQPASVENALALYLEAVEQDPEYALAWAGIAHAATTATVTADARPDEMLPVARHALEQASQYGADLAETHVASAAYAHFIDWAPEAAEIAARQAVELNPNNAMAYNTLAMALAAQSRHPEARAAMRRGRQLDPLFPLMYANSAYIERAAGNTQAAMEFGTQAIAIDPEFWVGYFQLGRIMLRQGQLAEALTLFENADRFSGGNTKSVGYRAYVLGCLGRHEEARELRDQLIDRSRERYVPPFMIALAEAGLGNIDAAFEWVNRGIEARDTNMIAMAPAGTTVVPGDSRFEWLVQSCKSAAEGG